STTQQNAMNRAFMSNNTSGIIGVYWSKANAKWRAVIGFDGKKIHLGYYENKEEAIKIRLQAEKKYFGEFAPQRKLFEKYGI
ncbi:MAG TPA: hypothetical protein DCW90_10350, partial [Lachnospiraceae bacterium]|nr:hypothetical protein [Lachnospiraceae bacterium]